MGKVKREEEKTVIKRRCVNRFSSDVFKEFGPMDESGSFGESCGDFCGDSCGFSMCAPAVSSCVLVVNSVSLASVGVLGEVFLWGSDCGCVESQSFSLSGKRQAIL